MSEVALPPGLYKIYVNGEKERKLLTPSSPGQGIKIGTITERNVWQISGDGRITSFPSRYSSRTINKVSTLGNKVVADKMEGMRWIICVKRSDKLNWIGSIMTGDATGLVWAEDAGKVILEKITNDVCLHRFRFESVRPWTPSEYDNTKAQGLTKDKTNDDGKGLTQAVLGREALDTFLTLLILILYKSLEILGVKPRFGLTIQK
ncbi:hypothetical protein FB446DRAFT_752912 [Lentinula raphanica]|nr:hypothetical protein FB446DRAFT_752912 [Lentinula raphanica]